MGGVLPVLQRAQGAPPAARETRSGEGPVLYPPAPGRNRVVKGGAATRR